MKNTPIKMSPRDEEWNGPIVRHETIELPRKWFERLINLSLEAAGSATKEKTDTKYSKFWHRDFPTLQGYISSIEIGI